MIFNTFSYLYVEDDPLSREVMQMIMENAMEVQRLTMFEDSQGFVERLAALAEKPHLILLDIHMKPIDGFAMLRLIRENVGYKETKVVALTASVMNDEVDKLRASGFDGAIAKPLKLSSFPSLIERILNGEIVWNVIDD